MQQNGLGGMGNVPVGGNMGGNFNFGGGNMGGNIGVGTFSQNQNTANLLQQLIAQQQLRPQGQGGATDGGGMAGTKRSLDDAADDGGPNKKASV